MVSHFLGRFGCDQPKQPAHLLAYGIPLLLRQNQPGVGWTLSLETTVIADIEAVEDPSLSRRKFEMVVILSLNHARFLCRHHIRTPSAKGQNQCLIHGVFIEIEASGHAGR